MEINVPEVVAEVTAAFMRYERALTSNDVAVLDELFFDSPHTVRYGVTENLYGYPAIKAFRAARSPTALQRRIFNTVITTYGRDLAVANTEFQRIGAEKTGRQSQTWVRKSGRWQIVAAHVSLL